MNKLKLLRAQSGLSVRELGEKAGVNLKTVSLLENDRHKAQLRTLGKLANALGVEVTELLDLLDKEAPSRRNEVLLKKEMAA